MYRNFWKQWKLPKKGKYPHKLPQSMRKSNFTHIWPYKFEFIEILGNSQIYPHGVNTPIFYPGGMEKSFFTHLWPYKFKFIEILDKSQNYPK